MLNTEMPSQCKPHFAGRLQNVRTFRSQTLESSLAGCLDSGRVFDSRHLRLIVYVKRSGFVYTLSGCFCGLSWRRRPSGAPALRLCSAAVAWDRPPSDPANYFPAGLLSEPGNYF